MDAQHNRFFHYHNPRGKLLIFTFLTAVLFLFFQSCELEPNADFNTVEPRLLNYDGFTLRDNALYGCIGEYPMSMPDQNGICHFKNVVTPYDLDISDYWGRPPYIYTRLSIKKPVILIPADYYFGSRYKFITFTVNFPVIENNKIGIVKFISKDLIDSVNSYLNNSGIFREYASGGSITIKIPEDKNSVTGKIIFLEGSGIWIGDELRMFTYDHYGIKDITIKTNFENEISFSQEEISTNPEEMPVTLSVTYPYGAYEPQIRVFLNFQDYSSNSKMIIAQFNSFSGQYTATVPVLPDLTYDIKIFSLYDFVWGAKIFPFKSIELNPGENGRIIHQDPELISPEEGKSDVNENDYLTAADNGESAIYMFVIYSRPSFTKACIVTDKNSIRWGDLRYKDFKTKPNTNYSWHVIKMTSFSSIDEFTESPYIFNPKFNSISESVSKNFKTAP